MIPRFFQTTLRTLAFATALVGPAVAYASLHHHGRSNVSFTATGSMGLRFVGTIRELAVADDGTNITVSVPLQHLSTGIDMRDEHTRNALDVAHHAHATLVVPRASLQFPSGAATNGNARGTMTVHGQSREVGFHYTAEPDSNGIHVTGTTRLDIRQFGMAVPSYLGVQVNPDVNVAVDFHVREQ